MNSEQKRWPEEWGEPEVGRVRTTFGAVSIGQAFWFCGRQYVKTARGMAQSDRRCGALFLAETVVDKGET
jgi:hypothetical protein